jgi:hypothetical protein
MPEVRTPVMTVVEASWEDPEGLVQTAPARMEDRSASGACIRIKKPIVVGAKLKIQWRFEQFFGTARYCRSEGQDYLVGIQRDPSKTPSLNPRGSVDLPPQKSVSGAPIPSPTGKVAAVEKPPAPQPQDSPATEIPRTGRGRSPHVPEATASPPPGPVHRPNEPDRLRISQPAFEPVRRPRLPAQPSAKSVQERKSMRLKWLELSPLRKGKDHVDINGDENKSKNEKAKENRMPNVTQTTEKAPASSAREVPTFLVELMPMEDIYRTAGIMTPRKGYSIKKVVEMLQSERIRGLSPEMKRAAVLMALDAAGISLEQVEQDALARRQALDSYEAAQSKQLEAEWARKAQEVLEIQEELETFKAHYMARISRNLEGVAREKAAFAAWLALKQQECQDMAEAVEQCLKPAISEPASAPLSRSSASTPAEVSLVKVSAKTV